jgi:tetratricopeptide (TPR) repeat protein
LAGAVITITIFAVYLNSLKGPFVFDDEESIPLNSTIRHLGTAFSPPSGNGITVSGRPVLNASFALNYAIGGNHVAGFHLGNVIIHILAALTLLAVARHLLQSFVFNGRFSAQATLLATCISILWSVHPLLTESVTYTVQRAESLVGLFYLLTVYGFIRYAINGSWVWLLLTSSSCLLGMGTKEVMATAPLVVFLYDRTFVSGSFRAAWHRHRGLHLCLTSTLLLLAALVIAGRARGGTLGVNETVTWWSYVCTQPVAIVRYLWLTVWPMQLTFDYGTLVEKNQALILLCALATGVGLFATVLAVLRKPSLGFLGVWFFAILAPSSSLIPIVTQTVAEHRMYLSLAALVGLGVVGLYTKIGRYSLFVFIAVAASLSWRSIQRNKDYRNELVLWNDTLAKQPENQRAHNNVGVVLAGIPGRLSEAIAHYETALRLKPDYAMAHNNLGMALANIPGRLPEAIGRYETAVRLKPDYAEAHVNLGNALARVPGRFSEAIAQYETALNIRPDYAIAYNNRANLLLKLPDHRQEAIEGYETALRLNPDYAEAYVNLGNALACMPGRSTEAIADFKAALLLKPDYADAHTSLGNLLADIPERLPDAISEYKAALRIKPDSAEVHSNLASLLMRLPESLPEAIKEYELALRIQPDRAEIHLNLARALRNIPNQVPVVIEHLTAALQINPNDAETNYLLGNACLESPGRLFEAITHLEKALSIQPEYAEAHNDLGIAFARVPNPAQAIAQFEAALKAKPDFAEARENLLTVKQLLTTQPPQR